MDDLKDKYGASANMKNAIDAVKRERKEFGGAEFYRALWNRLATKEIISELEKWQAKTSREIEAEVASKGKNRTAKRKSKFAKTAAIATYLQAHPAATSGEIFKATGIHDSDVRRLWGPFKKALRESKGSVRQGYKAGGKTDAIDETAWCQLCRIPIPRTFWCDLCKVAIKGECKTCHFTNIHPEQAEP